MKPWIAAADACGLLTTATAARAGLTARDLRRLCDLGELIHLGRGWYALAQVVDAVHPWDRRRQIHLLRARAALAAQSSPCVASHHTGLVFRGLPTFSADLRQVHLTRLAGEASRRRAGLTVHAAVEGAAHDDGVIDPATAVVQAGCANGPMAALVAADAALHVGLADHQGLIAAAGRVRASRFAAVPRIITMADGRAESPGETRLRHAVTLMGFAVVPQVRFVDGPFVAVVDLELTGLGVVLEFDGFVKYSRQTPTAGMQTPAHVVFAEKIREDHIRELDREMVRVIWSDLDGLFMLRGRIEAAVARARRRHLAA